MNENEEKNTTELRRLRKMLKGLHELSEHATLSGAFKNGAGEAAAQYNRVVARLETLGVATDGFFPPLAADASFDQVGIVAKLLADYLTEDAGPSMGGPSGPNIVIGHLGMEGLDKLKDIGSIVREKLGDIWNDEKDVKKEVDVQVNVRRDTKPEGAPPPMPMPPVPKESKSGSGS